MVPSAKRFAKDETGALLVFFAICCAVIFLLAALSFDIGRRAATHAEMQSFVDNVALSAAGELDGLPGAMQRARNAANDLIVDSFVIGEGDKVLATASDYNIYFYQTLPAADTSAMSGALDQAVAANNSLARFVRVAMNQDGANDRRVQVPWVFAQLLSIFTTDDLPDDMIDAEAVAGYTGFACDVSPVFFCMPPAEGGVPWNPDNNVGDVIKLVAEQGNGGGGGGGNGGGGNGGNGNGNGNGNGGGGSGGGTGSGGQWSPGNFAWLNVLEQAGLTGGSNTANPISPTVPARP